MIDSWKQKALNRIFRLTNGKSVTGNYSNEKSSFNPYPVYGGNGILGFTNSFLINDPTVIIGRVGEYCGNVTLSENHAWVSDNALYISEYLEDIDQHFLVHLMTHINLNRYNDATGQPKITQSLFKRIKPLIPNQIKEQKAIAGILSKVDEAIEAVENSIKAAERLKKSLMQNLLTGKLKPDGTWRSEDEFYVDEKFGKVPKGWEVKRLKDVFHVNSATLPSKTDPDFEFRYITIEAVNTEIIDYKNCPKYQFKESPGRARRTIKSGDILISGVRPNLKSFAIYKQPTDENWICSTGFFVLTTKEGEDNKFHFFQILSSIGASQFYSYVAGTNYPAIGGRDIRNMRLYHPSHEEQCQISEQIEAVSKQNQNNHVKIVTLKTLKKSLMQHLLTGKVRVDVKKINKLLEESQ